MNNLTKIVGIAGLVIASAFAGDKYNILDNAYYPWKYADNPIASDCYQEPFELKKRYRINKKNELEVFFGHGKLYRVKRNLTVNQKSFTEMLEEKGESLLKQSENIFESIVREVLESEIF